jgi:hypothetical protein
MKTLLTLALTLTLVTAAAAQVHLQAPNGKFLGNLNSNPYDPNSVANPYGRYGNPYGDTITNPYSQWGSPYSPNGVRNPYATGGPRIVGDDD